MEIKTKKWDVLEHLKTDGEIATFLETCLEDNDYDFFIRALNTASRARGINTMAQKIGVPRESLYKSLSGNHKPNFETIFKTMNELGFNVHIVPKSADVAMQSL
ncbi:transcriptional regulator [Deferribacterales bacterium]|nr:transcriptional regulator [Deferribacterales bacterium]